MTPAADTAALILAGGESRRMGVPKALLPLGDETVLEKTVQLFLSAGIHNIRVVTGHHAETIRSSLPDLPVEWIHNDTYKQGMFSSIIKGVETIGKEHAWFFLLPVDIPLVRPRTVFSMLKSLHESTVCFSNLHPTFLGRRGHPPLISTRLIPDILAWDGHGGLAGFLSVHTADAFEIPVIDEFIGRDMDTPQDYKDLQASLPRYDIPSPPECEAMLSDASFFKDNTAAHCRQVARLSAYFAKTLVDSKVSIDIERITAAALLHDIAKGTKNHAAAGAELLLDLGYSGISDIVSAHMDIDIPDAVPITEPEVVYLADKLILGDTIVSLSVRFGHKLEKYGDNPSVRALILKRKTAAEAIAKRISNSTGRPFNEIMDNFKRTKK